MEKSGNYYSPAEQVQSTRHQVNLITIKDNNQNQGLREFFLFFTLIQ